MSLRIVLVTPSKGAPSETFIQAHIARLPFTIIPLYGHGWDLKNDNEQLLWPMARRLESLSRKILPRLDAFDLVLARHLSATRADAVLAEYGTTGASLVAACLRARVPLFVNFFGFDASRKHVLERYRSAYQRLFAASAGIVAISGAMRERLEQLGAPPARLHLNPCGADPQRFCGAEPANSAPLFVAVGRFVEKKAPYLTVLAFREVVQACPQARLAMVGDGPLLGPTKRLAGALGISSHVDFLGVQSPDQVSALMRGARAFVQHSLEADDGDSEGTPVAIVEAQMTGLPVVSTRHAGIPEVVLDGETGYLVAEGDAVEMGARMKLLATDAGLAGRLGDAARQRALSHFTMERHISALAAIIAAGVRRE